MSRRSSRARGRSAAREVIERFALREPADIRVEALAWALGAEIVEGELAGAVARLVRVGRRARIRLSDRSSEVEIRRFSIAHELGHLVLGHMSRGVSLCHVVDGNVPCRDGDIEAEANGFAAELLMPERLVTPIAGGQRPSLDLAFQVSRLFRTSLAASAIRMTELSAHPCASIYAEGGKIRWASRSDACEWPLARVGHLPPGSAARACHEHRLLSRRNDRAGVAWGVFGDELVEEAFAIDGWPGILTVLSQSERGTPALTQPRTSA